MAKTERAPANKGASTGNDKAKLFQVLSPATYEQGDKQKITRWTPVGIGFESKDKRGINLEIAPGISVSGRIVIRPYDPQSSDQAGVEPMAPGRFVYDTKKTAEELM